MASSGHTARHAAVQGVAPAPSWQAEERSHRARPPIRSAMLPPAPCVGDRGRRSQLQKARVDSAQGAGGGERTNATPNACVARSVWIEMSARVEGAKLAEYHVWSRAVARGMGPW